MRCPVAIWLVLAACSGDEPKDTGLPPEADADTDTDADSDADTDTDTDSDADTDTGTRTIPADLSSCMSIGEHDEGNNGSIEAVVTSLYDELGLLVSVETDDDDTNTPALVSFIRDAQGGEIERQFDNDGDGTIDDRWTYVLTPEGEITSYCADTGDDGVCDFEERIAYDEITGLRALYERDSDGDGIFESTCTYTYDGQDRRTGYDCDGALNQIALYTYTEVTVYDYIFDLDIGRNGTTDQSTDYRFDTEGRSLYVGSDADGDGALDTTVDNTYNPDGTISVIESTNANPAALLRWEYSYEAEGYLSDVLFGADVTGDGLPDQVVSDHFTWTCP